MLLLAITQKCMPNKAEYVLMRTESQDNEGTRTTILPILESKAIDARDVLQGEILGTRGTLAEVMVVADAIKTELIDTNHFLSVVVESPEERAARRPADKDLVLPDESI